jgi:hypothetical protein
MGYGTGSLCLRSHLCLLQWPSSFWRIFDTSVEENTDSVVPAQQSLFFFFFHMQI